jgi:IPT/TIG domain
MSGRASEGPIAGGTSVILSGQNFAGPSQVKFGAQQAANPAVTSPTQIQVTSPSSVVNGAVNVTAYFQNSWLALAPDAFSYGPQILQVFPNAGRVPAAILCKFTATALAQIQQRSA